MKLYRIGLALAILSFLSPAFAAKECPSADAVRRCNGGQCAYQQFSGWRESVYYMDQEKPFSLQRANTQNTAHGKEISCYYAYFNPEANRKMPLALMLRTTVN